VLPLTRKLGTDSALKANKSFCNVDCDQQTIYE